MWIAGYYGYDGYNYLWVAGHWEIPPPGVARLVTAALGVPGRQRVIDIRAYWR